MVSCGASWHAREWRAFERGWRGGGVIPDARARHTTLICSRRVWIASLWWGLMRVGLKRPIEAWTYAASDAEVPSSRRGAGVGDCVPIYPTRWNRNTDSHAVLGVWSGGYQSGQDGPLV